VEVDRTYGGQARGITSFRGMVSTARILADLWYSRVFERPRDDKLVDQYDSGGAAHDEAASRGMPSRRGRDIALKVWLTYAILSVSSPRKPVVYRFQGAYSVF
jgi:hypothetical protein